MYSSLADFVSQFLGLSLLELVDACQRLGAHDATSPVSSDLIEPLIEVGLDGLCKLVHGSTVITVGCTQSKAGGSLASHKSPETSLVLNNAVWYTHLSAKSRQEQDNLQRIHIMSNDDQL